LRVLSEQTLETSKEVKDFSVPGPSLAKEVKDPSLTILSRHRYSTFSIWWLGRRSEGFSSSGGTPSKGEKFIFYLRRLDLHLHIIGGFLLGP
jgi:hypothetical protein